MTSPPPLALSSAKSCGAMALAAPLAQSMTMTAAVEREAGDGGEEEADVFGAVGFVDGRRFEWRFGRNTGILPLRFTQGQNDRLIIGEVAEDFGFDGEFGGVGKLVAIGAEELDAIVLPGIVRGGDDDAGGEVVGAGEEGDGGSGDDAGALDGGPGGGEAGG